MKIKEQLEMINEENGSIISNELRIYYILRHLVYDEPEERELFILGEFLLELIENIRTNAVSIDNVLDGLLDR